MPRFKIHLAAFLFVVFLFPQGARAMHYFLIAHTSYNFGEYSFNETNVFGYHSCTYHLNGFSPFNLRLDHVKEEKKLIKQEVSIKYCCLENYVQQSKFNFQLRGPPFLRYNYY